MTAASAPGWRVWVAGARVRTLAVAVAPVAVGAAAAVGTDPAPAWWRAGPALAVALGLQVGVNYANDYSDGVRGADGADRTGPRRLVGSGLAEPRLVKRAAALSFAVAAGAGLVLAAAVGWELLAVGAVCLLAAWGYTGGPTPYGYLGLGELFVFVFFGLVATAGTTYVLIERVEPLAVAAAVPVGLWATALLVANNLRDIPGDSAIGKRTLAVRMGDRASRWLYVAVLAAGYGAAVSISLVFEGRAGWAALAGVPFAAAAARPVLAGASGPALVPTLAATGRLQLVSGLGLAAGLALTG